MKDDATDKKDESQTKDDAKDKATPVPPTPGKDSKPAVDTPPADEVAKPAKAAKKKDQPIIVQLKEDVPDNSKGGNEHANLKKGTRCQVISCPNLDEENKLVLVEAMNDDDSLSGRQSWVREHQCDRVS